MRLIDADAIPYTMLYKENWMGCTGIEKRGVWKDTIDAMPTIEERKKGKWIIDGECIDCSVCRHNKWSRVPFEYLVKRFNFCPYCGADMRGEI